MPEKANRPAEFVPHSERDLRAIFGPPWSEITGRKLRLWPFHVIRGTGPRQQAPARKRPHRIRRKAG